MPHILSCDLGTTAVKAAIVAVNPAAGTSEVVFGCTVPTHANNPHLPPAHAEQSVATILATLDACVAACPRAALAACTRLAIASQMHGVVAFDRHVTTSHTTLVTWEDGRVDDATLARANSALYEAARATGADVAPVHRGYGLVTASWLADRQWGSDDASGAAAGVTVNAMGTLGAFVTHALISSPPPAAADGAGAPAIDPTDAASLGFWAPLSSLTLHHNTASIATSSSPLTGGFHAPSLAAFDARLLPLLPALVPTGIVVGALSAAACASLGLPALAHWAAAGSEDGAHHPVAVHVGLGDHPAAMAAAVVHAWQQLRLTDDARTAGGVAVDGVGAPEQPARPTDAAAAAAAAAAVVIAAPTVIVVNIGTSAQVAAVGAAVDAWLGLQQQSRGNSSTSSSSNSTSSSSSSSSTSSSTSSSSCTESVGGLSPESVVGGLPTGLEVRPFVSLPDCWWGGGGYPAEGTAPASTVTCSPSSPPRMLVGASMNGGNVLAWLVEQQRACVSGVLQQQRKRRAAAGSHRVAKLDVSSESSAALVENGGGESSVVDIDVEADDVYAHFEAAAAAAEGDSPSTSHPPLVAPLLNRERVAVGWGPTSDNKATGVGCGRCSFVSPHASTLTIPPEHSDSGSAAGVSVTGASLSNTSSSPGWLWAATADAIVRNVCDMLPTSVWRDAAIVVCTGGALARSPALQR